MDTNMSERRTADPISRRATLRGLTGAGLAALLAAGRARSACADSGSLVAQGLMVQAASHDPRAVIDRYVAAVNAGDLEEILTLYADDAVHVFLPSADGSAGVCLGKAQFRMWYEQSVANGDRIAVEEGTLAVDGGRASFVTRMTSDPWLELGVSALKADAEMVIEDGLIATHMVLLTPASLRQLLAANGMIPVSRSAIAREENAVRLGAGR
jgi:ketosteroid isomerase-like protein